MSVRDLRLVDPAEGLWPWDAVSRIRVGAYLDEERAYRYLLWRKDEEKTPVDRLVTFIALNPSTADETKDDPTIRRCWAFSHAWGHPGFVIANLFAYRATDPKALEKARAIVGPDNDRTLLWAIRRTGLVVCCWGAHGKLQRRGAEVLSLLRRERPGDFYHLGMTHGRQPKHPLYLPEMTKPILWG